jgi:hypothetical protein
MLARLLKILNSNRSLGTKPVATLQTPDSESFWRQLASRHNVWLPDLDRLKDVPLERLDAIAKTLIRSAERTALVQGVGLGFGGAATVLPDAGFLSAIILRLAQRLCLLYGIDSQDAAERAEMWKAVAAAAGLDYGKEFAEKHVLKKFAPQIAERLAPRVASETAGKWAARLVPVASSALGGALNFSLVRAWGRRMQRDFRERYLAAQSDMLDAGISRSTPDTSAI